MSSNSHLRVRSDRTILNSRRPVRGGLARPHCNLAIAQKGQDVTILCSGENGTNATLRSNCAWYIRFRARPKAIVTRPALSPVRASSRQTQGLESPTLALCCLAQCKGFSGETGESGQRWRCGRLSGWGRCSSPHADFHLGPPSVQVGGVWTKLGAPVAAVVTGAGEREEAGASCHAPSLLHHRHAPPCPSRPWVGALSKCLFCSPPV